MPVITSYGYTIATDFPNQKLSEDRLRNEIQDSSISIALDHINTNDTTCLIWFKDNLSASEVTELDTIVSIHSGESLAVSKVQEVQVMEENHKTGGHFQAFSVTLDVGPTVDWYESDVTWPFPISLLTAEYVGRPERENDEGEVIVGPDTVTGVLTVDSDMGDTVFNVSQTVIDNAHVGYTYSIDGDSLGRCLSINTTNNTITCETPASLAHLASTPSYVMQTVYMSPRIAFDAEGIYVVANSKIGGSYIPANTVVKFRYNNLSGTAKKFHVLLEYLY